MYSHPGGVCPGEASVFAILGGRPLFSDPVSL